MHAALAATTALTVARAAFARDGQRENLALIARYRPRHFLEALPVLAAVLGP